jgi:hypothetical protein
MYVILTGLSVSLMDRFDNYRTSAIALINASQFPEDVAIFLRQQINKDIDATIDLISKNPKPPAVLVTPAAVELPQVTVRSQPVFAPDEVAPVVIPPSTGA